MATTASEKKGKRGADGTGRAARPPKRKRRWLFTTTVLIGLPAALWFAPVVVSIAPILNWGVARATHDFKGTINIGSASLGWLSPVVVRDINVQDQDGKPLATVPLVMSEKTLLALLMSPRDLGVIRVEQPEVNIVLDEQHSNVEEAVGSWTDKGDKEPPRRVGVSLVVNEAVATIDDTAAGRRWKIDELGCEVVVPQDEYHDVDITASGRVTPAEPAGRFTLHLKFQPAMLNNAQDPATENLVGGRGEVAVTAQSLPLELFEPLLRRANEHGELSGLLETNLDGQWDAENANEPRGQLNGQVTVTNLAMAGPWSGDDRLRLDSISIPCRIVRDGRRVEVRRCEFQSDIGHLSCTGKIDDLGQFGPNWAKSLWDALPHSEGQVQGNLDLAKLSRVLPATLRVRSGMQIDEGAVQIDFRSGPENGNWACAGRIETTRLLATEQGRQISWDHPLLVTVAGHDTPQGPVIEHLNGQSDFLKFEGAGTPDYFGLTANFELARLAEELGQFLDLGELRLAGDGFSRLTWKRAPDDTFAADAELQATNFVLARPGKPAWTDPKLSVTATARGQLAGKVVTRVESASMQVAAATDEFTATLMSPVVDPGPQTPWPIEAHLRGELQRWLARVEPWINAPPGWDITGQAEMVSTVRYSGETIELEKCQADFTQLHCWGPTLFLDEPRMRVLASGRMTPVTETLRIVDASFTTADVTGRLQDGTFVASSPTGIERIGQAELQGNLATLHRWTVDPRLPPTTQVSGLMACSLHADLSDRSPAFDTTATIEDFAAVSPNGQQWREKQMRVTANATYDEPQDAVQLARFEVESEAVRLSATGKIDHWSQERMLALAGKTDYDLEKLTMLLQPYVHNDIRATGRESRSFSLAGPIGSLANAQASPAARADALQQWQGQADFGWQTASILGFDVGGANMQASLAKGILQVSPTSLNVSGGALTLAPTVRMSPLPAELYMPAGPLLTDMHITPEMCRQWMMYVAPVMAGVTRIDGLFSVQLAGCRVPVADPGSGEVAGQVVLHSINLEPGPLVREFSSVLGASASGVKLAQESKVDFKLVERRVYHRGLQLQFPEVMVSTYGSVGLDQTMAIMAELNVPPKWIRDNALGAAIKDKTLRVPITGTLNRPQLDRKVMDDALAQFVREAAGGALKDGLQRQLDRLLTPK